LVDEGHKIVEQVNIADLKAVSYLDTTQLGDRTVNLMPLWDGSRWHMWVLGPNGLIDLRPIDAMLVHYVSKDFASETDLLIPFVELMWQRASWPEICPLISGICDDFHNWEHALPS
jgi:hypothetical protein